MTEKVYCGNAKTIDGKFGKFLKLSFTQEDVDKLHNFIDNGWVNVVVSKRKELSKAGFSHYLTIDTYKRPGDEDGLPESDLESMKEQAGVEGEDTSELPF